MLKSLTGKTQIPLGWLGKAIWVYALPIVILSVVTAKLDWRQLVDATSSLSLANFHFAVVALILLPINTGLDALSWYFIVNKSESVSYSKCLSIVLSGRSLNVISPLGLGDAYIRYDQWPTGRIASATGIAMDRLIKMVPTFLFGIASIAFLLNRGMSEMNIVLYWSLAVLVVFLAFFVFMWKPAKHYLQGQFQQLKNIPSFGGSLILRLLCAAIVRYMVFSVQFLLIFYWMEVNADTLTLLMGIFWIFFFKSLLPNVTILGDLTKRELSALMFFSFFVISLDLVALASLLVWVLNIVLPAVVGLFFLSRLKSK